MSRIIIEGADLSNGRQGTAYPSRRLCLSRTGRIRRFLRRLWHACLAASALAATLAVLSIKEDSSPDRAAPAARTAPLPAWIAIGSGDDVFRLNAPELGRGAQTHEARRHRQGNGRQDVWTFGALNGADPYLRLVIYQVNSETAPNAPFFVDLARRAAETGQAITRTVQPTTLQTRFGAFEAAEMSLAEKGVPEAACLGFRFAVAAPNLRIAGFACGLGSEAGSAASRTALACLLDHIELAAPAGANDRGLAAFFAARPARRDPACLGARANVSMR